jgi:tetratricopeptide (TPR) repeat protein
MSSLSEHQLLCAVNEWQLYDINKDGRFDKGDIITLKDRNWQGFDQDVNRDGKKDINDALYLYVKLSVLDINCNGIVDDGDVKPVARIAMPEAPEINEISSLVSECISKSAARLPADIESQVFRSVAGNKILSPDEKAYVYQLVGITSLAKRNLEVAKWGFGKASQIKSQSSLPYGNLAFCLAMERQDDEALLLLSYARKLFPRSATTATTIGWIFARHGQNEEARKYYEEAVLFSPRTGQYHYNFGVILLRLGKNTEAWKEFRKASELNPGDNNKFLFSYLTKPADVPPENKPLTESEIKEENSRRISEAKKAGWTNDELPAAWESQSCCEQAITIVEILEQKYQKKIEEMAQVIANNAAMEIEGVIKPYMPEWKDFCKDWKRYIEGLPVVYEETHTLSINAGLSAGDEEAELRHKLGVEILGHSSEFMNCAVRMAEAEYKTELEKWDGMEDMMPAKELEEIKKKAYKEALKNAVEQCYKTPVNIAYGHLMAKSVSYTLPYPEVKTIGPDAFYGLMMVMPLACLEKPGNCNENTSCYTGRERSPAENTDNEFSIDLWIISIEYNSNSGEWEFNVDLGITLGATWNPSTGFGLQMGLDVSVGFFAGFEGGIYFKYDEGEWTYEEEAGFYAKIGPFSYAAKESDTTPITGFQAVPEEPSSL